MHADPLGLWGRTAPPAPPAPRLTEALEADVVVVGAGYTGLSAALHLAEAGVDVIVLEAAEIGFGGSGRNVGLVNAGLWLPPTDVIRTLGTTYGERLVTLLSDAPSLVFDLIERHGIDCEATRTGTLHCAVGRRGLRQLEARAAQWQALGAPVRLLDRAEAEAKTGSGAFEGALLDRRAGTIQPLAYARGLAKAAAGAGARLFVQSPVVSAARHDGRWTARTPEGAVSTEWIVVATNAYTQGPWPEINAELVRLPLLQLRHTAALRQSAARHPAGTPRRLGHPPGAVLVSARRRPAPYLRQLSAPSKAPAPWSIVRMPSGR